MRSVIGLLPGDLAEASPSESLWRKAHNIVRGLSTKKVMRKGRKKERKW